MRIPRLCNVPYGLPLSSKHIEIQWRPTTKGTLYTKFIDRLLLFLVPPEQRHLEYMLASCLQHLRHVHCERASYLW